MMRKRGFLLSLMIIIGVVVLITFFLAFTLRNEIADVFKPRISDVSAVQVYVENCVDAVSKYGIYRLGKQGGILYLEPGHFSHAFLRVNYAFDEAKAFPGIEGVENELEFFIGENIKNCTRGFRGFQSRGMRIEEGNATADVIPGRESVIVKLHYPLRIMYEDRTFVLEKFQKAIPVKLRKVHSETDSFLDLERYDLLYLNEMDANVYITPFDEADLFVEERLGSRINAEDYLFIFAVK